MRTKPLRLEFSVVRHEDGDRDVDIVDVREIILPSGCLQCDELDWQTT